MTGQTSILPKTSAQQGQSLINKLQPSTQPAITPGPSNPQKVHILKSPDGKLQVRGLMPGTLSIIVLSKYTHFYGLLIAIQIMLMGLWLREGQLGSVGLLLEERKLGSQEETSLDFGGATYLVYHYVTICEVL